jgi:site-specific DNA recombinase
MSRRAALYARVSTAHQEQEQTVASQVAALERAAEVMGLTLRADHRYIDEGFSGSRLDRPAFDALRDAAADGLIDIVLVHCPDRLARNYVHQQVVIEELTKRGVEVHFVEHPIGERAEDRLLLQMQGVIAEYERAKIVERTRRGTLHKVRSGQMLPFSRPPYGYAILRSPETPRGVLVVDEIEAEHVRSMFRWMTEEGLGVRQIAKRLNELGVRPKQRPFWVQTSVYRILTNTVYVGKAVYGKREFVEPKRPRKQGGYRKNQRSSARLRPSSQWIEIPVPAIIEVSTRDAALSRMAENKWRSPRNTKYEYLLRSLVVCGQCNWRMSVQHQTVHRYDYAHYACMHRAPEVTGRATKCTSRRVRAQDLDRIVWETLVGWIQSPEMLLREIDAWRASRARTVLANRDRIRLDAASRHLEQQIDRLIDAYQRGAISVDELKARRERLEAERDAAHARREELLAQEMDRARLDRLSLDLEAFAASLRDGLTELDFAARQRLVRLLVERVVVTGDEVAIEHAIPLSGRFSGLRSHQ